jgi:hypothetical protein
VVDIIPGVVSFTKNNEMIMIIAAAGMVAMNVRNNIK